MFKILVPTDFSPEAHKAALFALEIAAQMNEVEVNFFHCIETTDVYEKMVHQVEDILLKEAEGELRSVAGKYSRNIRAGIHIQYDLVFGNVVNEIIKKTKAHETDLIIMGTRGAGGFKKFFLGSIASGVVEETTDCPVLVVPEEASLKPVKKVTYATDMEDLKSEASIIIALARLLDAQVEILHITDNEEDLGKTEVTKKAYELVKEFNYSNIVFREAYNLDVLDGIENNVKENRSDLVAMFSRRKSYFDRLFDKSFTKEMSFHSHIPLLVLPYELTLK